MVVVEALPKVVPDTPTLEQQARAADPANNAWVGANAGSGKTYVLSTRVIRLMLKGVKPESILCLTYTKAAAAEMKTRVFDRLAAWLPLDDAALSEEITGLTGGRVSAATLREARTLFARALETPGGLKIQTIHAFCEAVLHRFPIEANVPAHFEMLDDAGQAVLMAEARSAILTAPDAITRSAMQRFLSQRGDFAFDKLLDEITRRRLLMERVIHDLGGDSDDGTFPDLESHYGFGPEDTREAVLRSFDHFQFIRPVDWQGVLDVAREKPTSKICRFAQAMVEAGQAKDAEEINAILRDLLITGSGGYASSHNLFTKPMKTRFPELGAVFEDFFQHLQNTIGKVILLDELATTRDVLIIGRALLGHYDRMKKSRGYLDFDDLIDRTAHLLERTEVAAWVRYKLDAGIDHLLVDEAQDTSPLQWTVIDQLTDEFHSGEGAATNDRTLFVVGDEKQSIYSFQGARPDQFHAQRVKFARDLGGIDRQLLNVPLTASFRSVTEILDAVDRVFADPNNADGLGESGTRIEHRSLRHGQHGAVEIWPVCEGEKAQQPEDWSQPQADGVDGPAVLADRIADTIDRWLKTGEPVRSGGLPATPDDILILVRKRTGIAKLVSRALKSRGVPVAGADRLKMKQHIAVLDLLSLARALLEPEDDLSLAECLKSPLFGFTDDDLLRLAAGRGDASLMRRLEDQASTDARCAQTVATLSRWGDEASHSSAFDFYAQLFARDGVRERLVARLGAETPDMLDEFLTAVLAAERDGATSLQQFVRRFELSEIEIKREQEQGGGQVRIMTVHGAKGLEAPIVFLVDAGQPPKLDGRSSIRECEEAQMAVKRIILPGPDKARSHFKSAAEERLKLDQAREYRRLLYVGMTRAAERLIICEAQKSEKKSPAPGPSETWHDMVSRTLGQCEHARTVETPEGPSILFELPPDGTPVTVVKETEDAGEQVNAIPGWFADPAPDEPPAPRPLAASGVSSLVIDVPPQTGSMLGGSLLDGRPAASRRPGRAAERGTALHTLLQFLPDCPPDERVARAHAWCRRALADWPASDCEDLAAEALAVLDTPLLAASGDAQVVSEVALSATMSVNGEWRAVSGVIDRLIVDGEQVTIIDYKSNQAVPASADELPASHVAQMALYRAMAAPLYPDRQIVPVLIYTRGPVLFEVPEARMSQALDVLAIRS